MNNSNYNRDYFTNINVVLKIVLKIYRYFTLKTNDFLFVKYLIQ